MRSAAITLTVFSLTCLTGASQCQWLHKQTSLPPGTPPLADEQGPSFVAWLNKQAQLLQSVRYDKVSVSAEGPDGSVRLRDGILVCSKPRNFRIIGDHLLKSEAFDAGSNDQEFWMVVRQPDPTLMYCSHEDFTRGKVNLPVPFDTDWVLQALGMNTYDVSAVYSAEANQKDRTYTLSWDDKTPQGEPVHKEILFAGNRAYADKPQVLRHVIMDTNRRVIASAEVKEVRSAPASGSTVQMPTHVVLEWPQQKFKMDLKLDFGRNGGVNLPMSDKEMAYYFTRPKIDGVSPINLATTQFRPSSSYRGATPDAGYRQRLAGGR